MQNGLGQTCNNCLLANAIRFLAFDYVMAWLHARAVCLFLFVAVFFFFFFCSFRGSSGLMMVSGERGGRIANDGRPGDLYSASEIRLLEFNFHCQHRGLLLTVLRNAVKLAARCQGIGRSSAFKKRQWRVCFSRSFFKSVSSKGVSYTIAIGLAGLSFTTTTHARQ